MKNILAALACLISTNAFAGSVLDFQNAASFKFNGNISLQSPKNVKGLVTSAFWLGEPLGDFKPEFMDQPGAILRKHAGCTLEKNVSPETNRLTVQTLENHGKSWSIRLVKHEKGENIEIPVKLNPIFFPISANVYRDEFALETKDDQGQAISMKLSCMNICTTMNIFTKKSKEYCDQEISSNTLQILETLGVRGQVQKSASTEDLIPLPSSLLTGPRLVPRNDEIPDAGPIEAPTPSPASKPTGRIGAF